MSVERKERKECMECIKCIERIERVEHKAPNRHAGKIFAGSALAFWVATHWRTRRFILTGRIFRVDHAHSIWHTPELKLLQQTQLSTERRHETAFAQSPHLVKLSFARDQQAFRKANWLYATKPNALVEIHAQEYAARFPWQRSSALVIEEIHGV